MPQATCHTCLINVVKRGAFIRPVAVTLLDTVLSQGAQHDNDSAAMFPHHLWARQGRFHCCGTAQVGGQSVTHFVGRTQRDSNGLAQPHDIHLPEVSNSVGQWPLRGNVCWHPWVMVNLEKERGYQISRSSASSW